MKLVQVRKPAYHDAINRSQKRSRGIQSCNAKFFFFASACIPGFRPALPEVRLGSWRACIAPSHLRKSAVRLKFADMHAMAATLASNYQHSLGSVEPHQFTQDVRQRTGKANIDPYQA